MTRMMKPIRYTPNEDDMGAPPVSERYGSGPAHTGPLGSQSWIQNPGQLLGPAVPEYVRNSPLQVLVAGHDEEGVGEAVEIADGVRA